MFNLCKTINWEVSDLVLFFIATIFAVFNTKVIFTSNRSMHINKIIA